MDGWGVNPRTEYNAIKLADSPVLTRLEKEYPYTQLSACGYDVGLPEGIMGNSEVGHLNLGAGRIVWQDITRIDRAIESGEFFRNPAFVNAFEHALKNNSNVHLMGLVSDGCVHSTDRHYFALLEMAKRFRLNSDRVFFHAFLDGRDTPPKSGAHYVEQLEAKIRETGIGRIVTISGRYYAMDRDKRWERLILAYDALTTGAGVYETEPVQAVRNAYQRNETDEFIKPIVMVDENKNPVGRIKENDSIIYFNFRADRAREIARAFTEPEFKEFPRKSAPKVLYTTMTMYDATFTLPVAFGPVHMKNLLTDILAANGLRQLRIAETEKYAHVTYFFSGGVEKSVEGEERILVPSPKVPTYDLKPEMNANEVTDKVVEAIKSKKFDVIVINYANCDMVGHTGILNATIKAVETVDACAGRVVDAVLEQHGAVLLTADHGNAELMLDYTTREPHTAHTVFPVPFTLADDTRKNSKLRSDGKLCDVAPTILELLGLPKPSEMEGKSLLSL